MNKSHLVVLGSNFHFPWKYVFDFFTTYYNTIIMNIFVP